MAALPFRPRWSAAVFWQNDPNPNWKCADVTESPVAVRTIRLSHGILVMSLPSEGGMLSFSASPRFSLSEAVNADSSPGGHEVSVGDGVGDGVSVGSGDGVSVGSGVGEGRNDGVGEGSGGGEPLLVGSGVGEGRNDGVGEGSGGGVPVLVGSGVGVSVGR